VFGPSARKFHDIRAIHPSPITTEAIDRIRALYGIEEEIRGKPADLRCEVRLGRARPLIYKLRSWMKSRPYWLR
jgi:transposase